jgi:hypothetical protein
MKYCSVECQRKDWKEHKKACGQICESFSNQIICRLIDQEVKRRQYQKKNGMIMAGPYRRRLMEFTRNEFPEITSFSRLGFDKFAGVYDVHYDTGTSGMPDTGPLPMNYILSRLDTYQVIEGGFRNCSSAPFTPEMVQYALQREFIRNNHSPEFIKIFVKDIQDKNLVKLKDLN